MIEVKLIKEVKARVRGASRWLLEADGNYYVASSIPAAPDTGRPETLIFPSDEEGNITNHTDLAGGIEMSVNDAIAMFQRVLNGEQTYSIEDSPMMVNAGGNPLAAMMNTFNLLVNPPSDDYYEDEDE